MKFNIESGASISLDQKELLNDLFLGQMLMAESEEKDFEVIIKNGVDFYDAKEGSITAHPSINGVIDSYNAKYIGPKCGVKSL